MFFKILLKAVENAKNTSKSSGNAFAGFIETVVIIGVIIFIIKKIFKKKI